MPTRQIDGQQSSEQADIYLGGGVERVNVPQNAPLFQSFEGHTPPQPPPKLYPLALGVIAHHVKMTVQGARLYVRH